LREVADSFAVTVNRGERYPVDVTEAFHRELRAMEAVVRAAERSRRGEFTSDRIPGCLALDRALSRLARLSGSRRGGGR
jgi:hypothetical protein